MVNFDIHPIWFCVADDAGIENPRISGLGNGGWMNGIWCFDPIQLNYALCIFLCVCKFGAPYWVDIYKKNCTGKTRVHYTCKHGYGTFNSKMSDMSLSQMFNPSNSMLSILFKLWMC